MLLFRNNVGIKQDFKMMTFKYLSISCNIITQLSSQQKARTKDASENANCLENGKRV